MIPAAPSRLRLAALVATFAASMTTLLACGSRIAGPVMASGPDRVRWAGPATPPDVAMGIVRAAATVGTAYLIAASLLELVAGREASGSGRHRLHLLVHRVRLPGATALVRRMAGVGMAVSIAGAATVAPVRAGATAPDPVVMRVMAAPSSPPPVMRLIEPPARPAPAAAPSAAGGPRPSPAPARRATCAVDHHATTTPTTWVIEPGDHLWRVASHTLASAWGHPAPDDAVARYLDAIIAANRDVFVVRGDADLVYPGQRFALPAPPSE